MKNNHGLSFLVFCYNSEHIVEKTLSKICRQERSHLSEIIVIDNNSTDNTYSIANEYLKKNSQVPFQVILEHRQGLNYARERAISEAKLPFCIMVDDDNLLIGTNWIARIVELFKDHPEVGVIGGGAIADTGDASLPLWWGRDFKLGDGEQREDEGVFEPRKPSEMMRGACLSLRTDVAQKCYQDLPMLLSDRAGTTTISSGGDIEIECRMMLRGCKAYYDKQLKFDHIIHPSRLNDSYLLRLFHGHKTIYPVHLAYHELLKRNKVRPLLLLLKALSYCCVHLIRSISSYLLPKTSKHYYKYYVNRIHINSLIGQYELYKKLKLYRSELNQYLKNPA